MLHAPTRMVQFGDGQWRKLTCDCLSLYELEEMTGKTIEEFFDARGRYRQTADAVIFELKEFAEVLDENPARQALAREAADLLRLLTEAGSRPMSDWYKLCFCLTKGFRMDTDCPLDFRGFLRIIPTGPAFTKLTHTMAELYREHLLGVQKAVDLGNGSASGQTPREPVSPPVMTGPGVNTSPESAGSPIEPSGGEASPVTTC